MVSALSLVANVLEAHASLVHVLISNVRATALKDYENSEESSNDGHDLMERESSYLSTENLKRIEEHLSAILTWTNAVQYEGANQKTETSKYNCSKIANKAQVACGDTDVHSEFEKSLVLEDGSNLKTSVATSCQKNDIHSGQEQANEMSSSSEPDDLQFCIQQRKESVEALQPEFRHLLTEEHSENNEYRNGALHDGDRIHKCYSGKSRKETTGKRNGETRKETVRRSARLNPVH